MTYPSKVDGWIAIVLALVPAGLLLEAFFFRSILVAANRIEITYNGYRKVLISPRDRTAFLQDLSAHVPGLNISSQERTPTG